MTRLRQVQDFRYLVGAKRIKQMRAALIQLGKEQLRERVKPLPRIFVQQQIKVGRNGIVLVLQAEQHTLRIELEDYLVDGVTYGALGGLALSD